ncbi:MAG: DUF2892 domain-containing protein [Candidatus Bilamarchaeaceae archaeon]
MPFEKNVGKTDRIVRFAAGFLLFCLGALYLGSPLAYAAYFAGLVLIATGALGTSPLYSFLKLTTLEPGEGCKCKEGEVCACAPECEICSPKPKEGIRKELSEEVPAKAGMAALSQRGQFAPPIPAEAEGKNMPPSYSALPTRKLPKKAKKAAPEARKPAKKKNR